MFRCALLVVCVGQFLCSLPAACAANDPRLEAALKSLIAAHRGDVAVAVRQLDSDERAEFLHRADAPMPTASLIKFPVMIETYRQAQESQVQLDQPVELRDEDKVPGSGILTPHFSAGARLPLRDAVRLMIAYSDNTATNLVLGQIGLASTGETMERWMCPHTKIHAQVYRGDTSIFPERSKRFGLGSTTAGETLSLLERLHRGELVSTEACAAMREHLLACQDRSKLPRFLPADIKIAHKTGSVGGVRCDAGILYLSTGAVAVCVLTENNADKSWGDSNEAEILCGRIGQAVWERFRAEDAARAEAAAPVELRQGARGDLVEDLQRTLNARLRPPGTLSIDGDFGPATAGAVRKFQAQAQLSATGVVDQATWTALGTLITEDEPVPAPEVIAAQTLPVQPPDSPDGPPFVTADAWILLDGNDASILAGRNAREALPMASTTKIMTAYIAIREIAADPQLSKAVVTFSKRADQTPGSTSGLRAGEQVSLGELLYGLLLPSGNDASVAIAEFLGPRFAGTPEQDGFTRFVAEMNRTARLLGMTESHFENPHGLPADGHRASARDLALLARAALTSERFQECVQTRQFGCQVRSRSGYRRNVLWQNTNRLLGIGGYAGVKTGTTSEAGACLVSHLQQGETSLLCVVLGSASTESRYTDTRNLFRWGLGQIRSNTSTTTPNPAQ